MSRAMSLSWDEVQSRYERFRSLVTADTSRPYLRALWPIVFLLVAIVIFRKAATAKDLADLIQALASLAWPCAALAIAYSFRTDIRTFLSRVRKGKGFGIELELDELRDKIQVAEVKAEASPISGGVSAREDDDKLAAKGIVGDTDDVAAAPRAQAAIEEVLRESARSPRLGLMLLSTKIERAARDLAENSIAATAFRRPTSLPGLIRGLVQAERLPAEAGEALDLFYQVRNSIVHGHDAEDEEVARAIDSGTRLLRLLLLIRPTPRTSQDGPS